MVGAGRAAEAPRLLLSRVLAQAEEPHVEIRRRHRLVHAAHGLEVVAGRGTDLGSGAVGQQREDARASWRRAHVGSPAGCAMPPGYAVPLGCAAPSAGASWRLPARAALSALLSAVLPGGPSPGMTRAYGPGYTSAICPPLSHLITYGGDPSAFRRPMTTPTRSESPSGTSRSPTRALIACLLNRGCLRSACWPRRGTRSADLHVSFGQPGRAAAESKVPDVRAVVPAGKRLCRISSVNELSRWPAGSGCRHVQTAELQQYLRDARQRQARPDPGAELRRFQRLAVQAREHPLARGGPPKPGRGPPPAPPRGPGG